MSMRNGSKDCQAEEQEELTIIDKRNQVVCYISEKSRKKHSLHLKESRRGEANKPPTKLKKEYHVYYLKNIYGYNNGKERVPRKLRSKNRRRSSSREQEKLWNKKGLRSKRLDDDKKLLKKFVKIDLEVFGEHTLFIDVRKMYPLTKHTLHQMFNDVKLQVDYEYEMAFKLLRLVKKQLKEGYVSQ
ncbi:hypothetical protein Tco_0461374 [Tanacetum coccineum]